MGLRTLRSVAFEGVGKTYYNTKIAEGGWDFGSNGPMPSKRSQEGTKMVSIFGKDTTVEARTAVIGVGGAGCRMVSGIYWDLPSVDTIAVNTDKEALLDTDADRKMFICKAVTKGEGTRGDSLLGKKCAQAHMEEIEEVLSDYDVVYIVAGMGGGTGSGAAPIIAEIAQRLNLIVFSIAVNPFSFETARMKTAKEGIMHLRAVCPMTVVIENDLVLEKMPDMSMNDAFDAVNKSVSAYICKQQKKIGSSFLDQFSHLGDFVRDKDSMPKNFGPKGVATN